MKNYVTVISRLYFLYVNCRNLTYVLSTTSSW